MISCLAFNSGYHPAATSRQSTLSLGQSVSFDSGSEATRFRARSISCRYFDTFALHSAQELTCRWASRTALGERFCGSCTVSDGEGTRALSFLLSICLSRRRFKPRHSHIANTISRKNLLFGSICHLHYRDPTRSRGSVRELNASAVQSHFQLPW